MVDAADGDAAPRTDTACPEGGSAEPASRPGIAVYARSDPASPGGEASIRRQVRACERYVGGRGYVLFADRVGRGRTDRPALRALLAAARTGKFEAVIVEGPDRISRDPSTLRDVYDRLCGIGVTLSTPAQGKVDAAEFEFRGCATKRRRRPPRR